jgi:prohibitin 1
MKQIAFLLSMCFMASCAVIRPGEAGVKQRFGHFSEGVKTEGLVFFNPITSKVVKASIQTNNIELF